jgi:hypothetical protein
MRLNLLLVLAALAISVAVYLVTGGQFVFFALPLLFGLPLLGRRREQRLPERGYDR